MLVISRHVCQPGLSARPPDDAHARAPLAEREDRRERALQRLLAAPDAGVVLHRQLQILVQLVRVLGRRRRRWRHRRAAASRSACSAAICASSMTRVAPARLRELRRRITGAPPEDEDVAERVAAEAVGAVQTARNLAGRVQPGHRRRRGLGLDAHTAHRVVDGRDRPPSAGW